MPLSGVSMISLNTWAAFCVRATSSSRSEAFASGMPTRMIVERMRVRLNTSCSFRLVCCEMIAFFRALLVLERKLNSCHSNPRQAM